MSSVNLCFYSIQRDFIQCIIIVFWYGNPGTYTGASALAWALAIPPDGQVITMDVDDAVYRQIGKPIIKEAGVANKIQLKLQPALKTLGNVAFTGSDFSSFNWSVSLLFCR